MQQQAQDYTDVAPRNEKPRVSFEYQKGDSIQSIFQLDWYPQTAAQEYTVQSQTTRGSRGITKGLSPQERANAIRVEEEAKEHVNNRQWFPALQKDAASAIVQIIQTDILLDVEGEYDETTLESIKELFPRQRFDEVRQQIRGKELDSMTRSMVNLLMGHIKAHQAQVTVHSTITQEVDEGVIQEALVDQATILETPDDQIHENIAVRAVTEIVINEIKFKSPTFGNNPLRGLMCISSNGYNSNDLGKYKMMIAHIPTPVPVRIWNRLGKVLGVYIPDYEGESWSWNLPFVEDHIPYDRGRSE